MILRMAKRLHGVSISDHFEAFSKVITHWTGSTDAFGCALGVIVGWALLGPVFHYSDTGSS